MRPRTFVYVLAILAVLAHAGALVRHDLFMVAAALEYQSLRADLVASCHGIAGPEDSSAQLPNLPQPAHSHDACAICLGLVSAAAVIPITSIKFFGDLGEDFSGFSLRDVACKAPRSLRPPARAPPLSA
jgi:hypothetical protein